MIFIDPKKACTDKANIKKHVHTALSEKGQTLCTMIVMGQHVAQCAALACISVVE